MPKYNAENERIKRRYFAYLREAKGQDQKSIDKAADALVCFEQSTRFRRFKQFHIEQAGQFKKHLESLKGATGKSLAITTIDAKLRQVKSFFHWLAGQQGFKKVLSYADVEYFNNNRKDARAAHTAHAKPYPSLKAIDHAFQAMPERTEMQRRDKAIFALVVLTGIRDSACASLRLKHVNLIDGYIFQDGREVATKNSKTIQTTFFPVGEQYLKVFESWMRYLTDEKLFGPEDALFPKPDAKLVDGQFNHQSLSREPYANGHKVNEVIKGAFRDTQQRPYNAHSFRKTLGMLMSERCETLEQQKAWSQNLGHENLMTTVTSYMPVSQERQQEIIRGFGKLDLCKNV